MTKLQHINLYTHGSARGNPGPGAIGIIVCTHDNKLLHEYSECIGHSTNNQAEYRALIKGLDLCAKYTRDEVTCFCDIELVNKQINAYFRLKNDTQRVLFRDAKKNASAFTGVTFQYAKRTNQRLKRADTLAQQAQDGRCIDQALRPVPRTA